MRSSLKMTMTAGCCVALAATAVLAVPPGTVRFTRTVQLPDAGLQIKLMPKATAQPLSSPTIHTYRMERRSESSLVDLYDPIEFWRRDQHIGQWVDEHGNGLRMARMTSLVPDELRGKHGPQEDIAAALSSPRAEPTRWTTDLAERWLADYMGMRGVRATEMRRPPRRFSGCFEFAVEGRPIVGYAVTFNTRYVGLGGAPDTWFVVLLNVAAGNDGAEAARETLHEEFLPALAPLRRTGISQPNRLSSFMQTRRYGNGGNVASGLEASRQQAESSIGNLKGWWSTSTDNYVFLSNLSSRHRIMARHLQEDLETLRTAYESFIPPLQPINAVSVVRVFATPEEYDAYVPPPQRWTSGLWIASKGELVVRPPADARDRQGHREQVLQIAYHESFHQYLHYALNRRQAAAWFNEGHAALFESIELQRRRSVRVLEDDRKAEILERLANDDQLRMTPILGMSYEAFYAGDDRMRTINYARAWGLCYYLRKAAPVDLGKRYVGIADAYIKAIASGLDASAATQEAFRGVDMQRFNTDMAEFWASSRRRRSAERHRLF